MINHFLHQPMSGKPLSLFRAVWGAFLIYYFLDTYWLLEFYFGHNGIQSIEGLTYTPPVLQWSLFYWVNDSPIMFPFVFGLALLSALGLCIGIKTRICSVISWICTVSLVTPISWGSNSADAVVTILSFLFMVCGLAGHTAQYFCLDAAGSSKVKGDPPLIPAWTYRLFQIQLCAIYFFSGLHKFGIAQWKSGYAISNVLQQTDSWMRVDFSALSEYPALIALITTSVVLFELILFPVFIWFHRTRLIILGLGVAYHLTIVLTMRVFIFTEVMIVFYLCFLTTKEVNAIESAVTKALSRLINKIKNDPAENAEEIKVEIDPANQSGNTSRD